MADKLKSWDTTPGNNNQTPPDGWPEGMAPSTVNDTARNDRARMREWYEDATWINAGHSATAYTSSSVTISGDVTATYVVDRAIRFNADSAKTAWVTGTSLSGGDTVVSFTGTTLGATPSIVEYSHIKDEEDLPADMLRNGDLSGGDGISISGDTVAVDLNGSSLDFASGQLQVASGGITGTELASGAVAQANLKTTTGTVSSSGGNLTLPGGEYGFYPQFKDTGIAVIAATISQDNTTPGEVFESTSRSSFVTNIGLFINGNDSGGPPQAKQRYIQASPPYDLGDGEIPMFVFAEIDAQGHIVSTYTAEDPPWANNGPTNTRPDVYRREKRGGREVTVGYQYRRRSLSGDERRAVIEGKAKPPEPELVEVDQSIKNADMGVIPHPFASAPSDHTVVLLDPVNTQGLHELHLQGESIAELLHHGYIGVDNEPIKRCCPNGVQPCRFRWKGGK